jgi:hypothetical protein
VVADFGQPVKFSQHVRLQGIAAYGNQPWHGRCNESGGDIVMKKTMLILAAAVMSLAPLTASAGIRVGVGFGGPF